MKKVRETGEFVSCSVAEEKYQAFVPSTLPPKPPLDMGQLGSLLASASAALGRLDGLAGFLPDIGLFIYMYVRKEALLSSQIEGTQSSFSGLLIHESEAAPGAPTEEDVQDVSNCIAALNHGLERMRGGFPLSLRLIREIHEILLSKGRGSTKIPGEFRRSQNWIGGPRPSKARFVPPPPERLEKCLGAFEKFLHADDDGLPVLIRAALAHVQFETIHPFLDGNGRVGRLLITLLLCADGVLKEPILYLSLWFKTRRDEYYDQLQYIRDTGDWEEWVSFFLRGVIEIADQGVATAKRILNLFNADQRRVETALGKAAPSALKILAHMRKKPIIAPKDLVVPLGLTMPTINTALQHLEKAGIVQEITGRQRDRLFAYKAYLAILEEGTEPLV
ncbi:Fic family protein [Nitrosomonas nitrosa]|uniref:Fic family protein n=1 Tax=Nitrosomonas nitrosa TaxID=52442 RepID=UPI000D3250CE|nr:Fic family protein [Nitrosomonas nitrosa]PTQ93122.1 Fic family protein [Nitrosomonas nitrosa]HNP52099.1 Fic family protein [Nitrosomonas nitrosa]